MKKIKYQMEKLKELLYTGGITTIAIIVLVMFLFGFSWLFTCGIIKLVTLCFGLTFKWSVATGIWLILCLLSSFLKSSNNK